MNSGLDRWRFAIVWGFCLLQIAPLVGAIAVGGVWGFLSWVLALTAALVSLTALKWVISSAFSSPGESKKSVSFVLGAGLLKLPLTLGLIALSIYVCKPAAPFAAAELALVYFSFVSLLASKRR